MIYSSPIHEIWIPALVIGKLGDSSSSIVSLIELLKAAGPGEINRVRVLIDPLAHRLYQISHTLPSFRACWERDQCAMRQDGQVIGVDATEPLQVISSVSTASNTRIDF